MVRRNCDWRTPRLIAFFWAACTEVLIALWVLETYCICKFSDLEQAAVRSPVSSCAGACAASIAQTFVTA